ncbi:MAG: hypothetical protein L0H31_15520 [Nocardioidaceae bacterium]|nr:hypothetical protein [Nocardioidaceae bacterium]
MIRVLTVLGVALIGLALALGVFGGKQSEPVAAPSSATAATPGPARPAPSSSPTATSTSAPTSGKTAAERSSSAAATSTTSASPTSRPSSEIPRRDAGGVTQARRAAESAPARKVATRLITALTRTGQPVDEWRREAGEFLTASGRQQLAEMGPAGVTFTRVTGDARLVVTAQPSRVTLPIAVPTDDGVWLVMVTRDEGAWRGLSFSPLKGEA